MKKVILTKGLPGCGKTTWAKQLQQKSPGQYKRINKDDLRAMLDDGQWSKHNEAFVLQARDWLILAALEDGKHVIVDDTNLHDKHVQRITQLVKGKAMVEIHDMTDVAPEVCIERDLKRPNSVGSKVIIDMYKQFIEKKVEAPVYPVTDGLPWCVICDIDGTLARMADRSPYDWSRVKEDTVNQAVKSTIMSLGISTGASIVLMTGRDGSCLDLTEEWLDDNGIAYDEVFIRPEGDTRKDSVVKRELFEQHISGKYNVLCVLDDRDQVVSMWRKDLGLPCFQVNYGDF